MLEKSLEDLEHWRKDIRLYEKNKRTKKPYGKALPRTSYVTHGDIK